MFGNSKIQQNSKLYRNVGKSAAHTGGAGIQRGKSKKEINVTTTEVNQEFCKKQRKLDFNL